MKTYRVEKTNNTVIEILVKASSEEEALRIAEEDWVEFEWDKWYPDIVYKVLGEEPNA